MKLKLTIPSSINEIPLKHYQEFQRTAEGSNDNQFISEKMIQVFCGVEYKDVINISAKDFGSLLEHFEKIFAEKPKFHNRFKLGGIEYGFIPDLENISWGEYIDAEKYLSKTETMHKAMAVLYRPIVRKLGDKYDILEYKGTADFSEGMKYVPTDIALGASLFFWTLGLELLEALADYLERETKKLSKTTTAKQDSLLNNGDGIKASMQLLKETFSNSIGLQKNPLSKS
jgi:hypothetical protein